MCERACGLEGCVAEKPKLLFVAGEGDELPASIASTCEIVEVHNPLRALARVGREEFDGIYVAAKHFSEALRLGRLLENDRILEGMPDAMALLDSECIILWANERLRHWTNRGNIVGEHFFAALGNPEIVGTEASPLRAALRTGHPVSSLLRTVDNRYFHLHAAPIVDPE